MKDSKGTSMEMGKLFAEVKKSIEKEGIKGWKLVQETIFKKQTDSEALKEVFDYAMFRYQPDYFRSALLSFCCRAVGGDPQPTIPVGAALTFFAWAIGIHDDIIDQSTTKNKLPTIYGKFGKDLSLIFSDILFFKGFTLFRRTLGSRISIYRIRKILEIIEEVWFDQSIGEVAELEARGSTEITPDECLRKIHLRAAEFEACTRIGGILGGGSERQVENLGAYGRMIGIMSILRNEIVDMLELHVLKHRLRRESLPLPLLHALKNPKLKSQLVKLITSSRLTKKELQEISKLSDRSGGIEYTALLTHKMGRKALALAKKLDFKELEIIAASLPLHPKEWKPLLSD
ncbi:MAG: polyprenyl synthetase family protein [Candidatus Bathyarchaeota archaeon]|nr:MAG: polyprenyl synthetase family protein [Candidatus Bathyarchaeota archaeon]